MYFCIFIYNLNEKNPSKRKRVEVQNSDRSGFSVWGMFADVLHELVSWAIYEVMWQ